MLTQDRLKELFSYDPLTGVFVNLQSSGKRKAGNIAGSKHNAGYVKIFADGASYLAHRLAHLYMIGELPTEHMDHINHIRSDNRWENLRMVGRNENNRNKRAYRQSASGISGVSWKVRESRWHAKAYKDGEFIYLGTYQDLFSAVCARKSAEIRLGYHENNGRY